ncbi:DEAD-domain-containing protein [Neoconidiobolus thromboides FSU 785]|nr:DEAD-domain-containing protein [Neoconidiobolus thromboides FSU 785]
MALNKKKVNNNKALNQFNRNKKAKLVSANNDDNKVEQIDIKKADKKDVIQIEEEDSSEEKDEKYSEIDEDSEDEKIESSEEEEIEQNLEQGSDDSGARTESSRDEGVEKSLNDKSKETTQDWEIEVKKQHIKKSKSFKDLGLSSWLIESIKKLGIQEPTEIQVNCIPEILKGKDVIGSAKTGSGKTAAFGLPMLHKLALEPYGIFGLVLTPTRELALQIAEQLAGFGEGINLKYSVIVGGMDMLQQTLELKRRPHIVIATPGRLADIINSSFDVLNLSKLNTLVLDEADRLLQPTFGRDLKVIFDTLPKKRQTLLFTATMTEQVMNLINKNNKEKFVYLIKSDQSTVEQLEQKYIFLPGYVKEAYLYQLINLEIEKSMIIFVNKCHTCELIKILLNKLEIPCTALHSAMKQMDRMNSLARFKANHTKILVCTDVASRGLDIPKVQLVINLDLPRDPVDYIHRVGRTARAGRGGLALSLVTERDIKIVQAIEGEIGIKMNEYPVEEDAVIEQLNKVAEAKRFAAMYLNDNPLPNRNKK